jgi:hypothetical protein
MTSPLHRKHQTTRRNFLPTSRGQRSEIGGQGRLLTRAFVAVMLCIACAAPASAELQWQKGKSPKSLSASKHKASFQRHRDSAVRPAAFEEESATGPRLTSADEGRATFRSVVVHQADESDEVRSAQLPDTSGTTPTTDLPPTSNQPSTPETDESLEKKIGLPFGEMPQQTPPSESENFAEPPRDGGEDARQLSPDDMRPETFRPFPAPDSSLQQEIDPDVTPQTPEPGTSQQSCDESWTKLKAKTIGTVDLSIRVTGKEGSDFPYECLIQDGGMTTDRCWAQTTYLWKASALCHKPLYFEDEQLERYGHSWPPCVQPLMSGAHFFCTLPVLPYCMGVEPPMECIYALGHYRPGNCAPYMINPVPLSARAAVFQGAAVTGAALVIP